MNNKVVLKDLEYINAGFSEKKNLEGSTILITGCAGFLGFYFMCFLAHYAKLLGIKSIVGLDNFRLGRPLWLENLVKRHSERVKILDFDIAKAQLNRIEKVAQTDFVIHMASIASPSYYRRYPLETIDANVWGLRSLLDYFRPFKLKGFLFFSSSEIYGDPFEGFIPTPEDYRGNVATVGPRACYDEAKRFGETLCYTYAREFGIPIVIVRPFNNYGPGMRLDDKRAPADFARAILENKDIGLYSNGTPTRTFCYVADAILGYLKALTYGQFEIFNIGNKKPEISISQFAEIFVEKGKQILNYSGSIIYEKSSENDYLTDNPSRRCPNLEKAKKLLGFNPSIDVNEGVQRFLDFLKLNQEEL